MLWHIICIIQKDFSCSFFICVTLSFLFIGIIRANLMKKKHNMSVPKHLLITIAIFDKFRLSKNQWTFFSLFWGKKTFLATSIFLIFYLFIKWGSFMVLRWKIRFITAHISLFGGRKIRHLWICSLIMWIYGNLMNSYVNQQLFCQENF